MCIVRKVALDDFANQHNPYVTTTWQEVPPSTWEGHSRVSATVRETGQSFSSDSESAVATWASGALAC
jgi:hypothetical protein